MANAIRLTTQMRFRVTNTREQHRKYDKGQAPLIEATTEVKTWN